MGAGGVISRDEFEQTLQRVERLLNRVQQEAQTLVERSNRAQMLLPAGIAGNLRHSMDDFLTMLETLFKTLREIMPSPGWPPALFEAGDNWTNKVGATASRLAGMSSADQTRVDEKWQGPAASAYTQALAAQAKALAAIKSASDKIDDVLFKLAAALVVCWVGLAVALVTYVAELCAASAATATVVGAPAGAAAAGISTAKMIAIVAGAVTAVVTLSTALLTQYKEINQRLHNNDGFPGGSWPKLAPEDLSDGTVADGDGSDWQLRYS